MKSVRDCPEDAYKKFHSSVNRIPIPRSFIDEELSKHADLSDLSDFFKDSSPSTRDHLGTRTVSGSVEVTITLRSPVVTGIQTASGKSGHVGVEVLRDENGNPIVSPSTIKGMLSHAYEQVTASRFRVFGNHEQQLTYRVDPAAATRLVPVRITRLNNGKYQAHKLFLARLYTYYYTTKVLDQDKGTEFIDSIKPNRKNQRELKKMKHGQEVEFAYERTSKQDEYCVTHIRDNDQWISLQDAHGEIAGALSSEEIVAKGYLYMTTRNEDLESETQELFKGTKGDYGKKTKGAPGKISEYIFFASEGETLKTLQINEEQIRRFQLIVDSYAYDSTEEQNGSVGRNRFSRDISKVPERTEGGEFDFLSREAFFAFAEISGNNIVGLYPTQVGRRTYRNSPCELAQKGRVSPPQCRVEASAADRLLGFTTPSDSLRGRLTIDRISLPKSAVSTPTEEKVLKPLLSPKPSSARRFLTGDNDFSTRDYISKAPRDAYFGDKHLLGSVIYPFKRTLHNEICFPSGAVDTHAFIEDASSKVTLHVKNWIKAGSEMKFTLRFENLSRLEFATLRWLLDSTSLYDGAEEDGNGFLRLGIGKPLGLGIVQVDADEESWRLYVPEVNLNDLYKELAGCLGYVDDEELSMFYYEDDKDKPMPDSTFRGGKGIVPSEDWDFTEDEKKVFLSLPNVRAFRRAATGYGKKATVRYMYLCENRKNNQTDSKSGKPKPGRGLAPQLLSLDKKWDSPLEIKDN